MICENRVVRTMWLLDADFERLVKRAQFWVREKYPNAQIPKTHYIKEKEWIIRVDI